jgi:hypothetical protein
LLFALKVVDRVSRSCLYSCVFTNLATYI